ncbi:hypothetical protein [Borreliella burgdorferi]|uniref:hypothetical protein n=1 Tax=Borreliella burgdorferi TaxID=139 RepID=UPI000D03CC02|nr:hypothetical protein [Borreliella burgdorferi]PRQ89598.1 hypothetical protein CV697_05550 [Borreliella burgdorferi]
MLHTNHANEAFKEIGSAKDKIDSSDMGKGIVDVQKMHNRLHDLLRDIKTEFYSQKNSFLNGVRAEKSKKKNQILFRSTSSINGKIRNANYIL